MIGATLFSGIGAPEQAMPSWDWRWHAEIEPFPSAVLAVRHPSSVNLGDVSAEDFCDRAAALGRPDVLVFGSPCQSYSVAGKRLGLDDPRGNLALVALGIIARLRPRWFTFENVPGLLSSGDGHDFGVFLRTVADIGYSGAWRVLDAQYFGVAQRRQRVFFVGHLGADWRRAAAVLLEPESLCGHPPTRGQARERIADTLTVGANQCGGFPGDFDASEDGTGRGTPIVPISFQGRGTNLDLGQNVTGTLGCNIDRASGGAPCVTVPEPVAFAHQGGGTQTTLGYRPESGTSPALSVGQTPAVAYGAPVETTGHTQSAVRRLMPIECERLQGFTDDFTAITYRGKPAADGPRYKAIGNSMAVPVVRWILERIEFVDQIPEAGA